MLAFDLWFRENGFGFTVMRGYIEIQVKVAGRRYDLAWFDDKAAFANG